MVCADGDLEEGADHGGIELRPRTLRELLPGGRSSNRRLIRADRRHRLEGVRHRDDSTPQCDLLASEAGWITGSIEPLVVLRNRGRPGTQP